MNSELERRLLAIIETLDHALQDLESGHTVFVTRSIVTAQNKLIGMLPRKSREYVELEKVGS